MCIRRRWYTDGVDGAHKTGWTSEQSTMNKFPRTSPARDTGKYDGEVELMPTSDNRDDSYTLQVVHERGAIGEYNSEGGSNSTILHLSSEREIVDGISTSIECKDLTLHSAPACGAMSENSAYPGDGRPLTLQYVHVKGLTLC